MFEMAGGARVRAHVAGHQRQREDQHHTEPEGGRRQAYDQKNDMFHEAFDGARDARRQGPLPPAHCAWFFCKNRGGRAHHGPPRQTTPYFLDSVPQPFAPATDIHMVSRTNFSKLDFWDGETGAG